MNAARSRTTALVALLALAGGLVGCAALRGGNSNVQRSDETFVPEVTDPAFERGQGPRVAIDGGHGNYHTVDGRYRGFAELLRRDGFVVEGLVEPFSAESLAAFDVLVIANAISVENTEAWALPNPEAFEAVEIEAVGEWVEKGGALWLIADHMPMPGAASELARSLGLLFHDGFAYLEDGTGKMTFRLDDGSLAEHPVTSGLSADEAVLFVTTFTGQAFRVLPGIDVEPLLRVAAGSYIRLPSEAWEFSDATPQIPADGMLQGALLRRGEGRVAVFGEAAMFSAQVQIRDDERILLGMNHEDAPHNARFARNVLHWLVGLLDE